MCMHPRPILGTLLTSMIFILAACGQVITRPTPIPSPTPTPAAVAEAASPTATPTATPAAFSPMPTWTPTVTPTPIIYTVQRGDTLSAIAQRFGVNAFDLQDVNGILDPRALQVGQELIVPQDEQARRNGGGGTPTPTPMPFAIENLHFTYTPIGDLWVLGEVYNLADTALEQVQVLIKLYGEDQDELGRSSAFVYMHLIRPDERSPFAIYFNDAPDEFASFTAEPLGGMPAYMGRYYRDLEVRDLQTYDDASSVYRLEGQVVNVGQSEAREVGVVVTAYNEAGQVVGIRKIEPEPAVIPAGGDSAFHAEIVPADGSIAEIRIAVQGRR